MGRDSVRHGEKIGRVRVAARRMVPLLLFASLPLFIILGLRGIAPFSRWSLNSLLLAVLVLAALALLFERREYGAREVAVVGALAAVGAAGRVFFAAIPGAQPATFLAVLSGYVLGAEPGFLVGALIALLSNLFLGQGPWTPWQMLAWGMAGASGGVLFRLTGGRLKTALFASFTCAWGFVFGWIMNLWFWLSSIYPLTWKTYLTTCAGSFWFDVMHAASNLAFSLALCRPMATMLQRHKDRSSFVYLGSGKNASRSTAGLLQEGEEEVMVDHGGLETSQSMNGGELQPWS